MTDLELLKLAANAAGIPSDWIPKYSHLRSQWNPLTDDGDALRLAVKLEMALDLTIAMQEEADVQASTSEHDFDIECNGDPYAATRRAIVRAAAEIGRSMP